MQFHVDEGRFIPTSGVDRGRVFLIFFFSNPRSKYCGSVLECRRGPHLVLQRVLSGPGQGQLVSQWLQLRELVPQNVHADLQSDDEHRRVDAESGSVRCHRRLAGLPEDASLTC